MQVTNLPPDGGPEVYACLLDSRHKFISDDKGLNWEHGYVIASALKYGK